MSEPPMSPRPDVAALAEAISIMARLRAPDGCPWDREQTFDSIKRHTLEETYEVFDAIDRRDFDDLKDELGDLLLQVLFYAQMADEAGHFSIADVAANLNAKLIRRHPHIFGDAIAHTAADVNRTWEAVKQTERAGKPVGGRMYLDDVPRHMPAILEAFKLGQRAGKVGFDWPDAEGLFEKLAEESQELRDELTKPAANMSAPNEAIQEEYGDLLFTAINLGRHLHVEPEFALRVANAKFRARFTAMERAEGGSEALRGASADELDAMWRRAKSATAHSEGET